MGIYYDIILNKTIKSIKNSQRFEFILKPYNSGEFDLHFFSSSKPTTIM